MRAIQPGLAPVSTLLAICHIFAVFHFWAAGLTGTQPSGEVNVVPESASLAVTPIAIAIMIIKIGVGLAVRKGSVL